MLPLSLSGSGKKQKRTLSNSHSISNGGGMTPGAGHAGDASVMSARSAKSNPDTNPLHTAFCQAQAAW